MRKLERALLAGGLGFAVSCIAGCGGGAGLLSGNQANTLNNQLNHISGALQAGHCGAAQSAAQQLITEVASLPSTLNRTLLQNLDNGATTVSQLAVRQCRPASPQTTSTPTTTTTTPTTTPTATSTTTTPTTTHTTTTTTPSTTPATTPPTTGTTTGPSGGSGLGAGSGGGASGGSGSGSGGAAQQSGGAGAGNGNGNSNG